MTATHDKALISRDEVARRLSIGLSTTKALLASGELPSIRIGRRRLVRVSDLEKFVASRAQHD